MRDTLLNLPRAGVVCIVGVALVLLAACETQVQVPTYADITFNHRPPIELNLRDITIRTAYAQPLQAPNVEHEFPVDLSRTAERWARDRLRATGATGSAVVTVLEASAVETELERRTGLAGMVTTDQSERYVVTVRVRIDAEDPARQTTGEAAASAERIRTVPEDASFNVREAIWYEMSEQVMTDFDRAMENAIRTHLGGFLTD